MDGAIIDLAETFEIYAEAMAGKIITLHVESSDTICMLKQQIEVIVKSEANMCYQALGQQSGHAAEPAAWSPGLPLGRQRM